MRSASLFLAIRQRFLPDSRDGIVTSQDAAAHRANEAIAQKRNLRPKNTFARGFALLLEKRNECVNRKYGGAVILVAVHRGMKKALGIKRPKSASAERGLYGLSFEICVVCRS